MTTLERTILTAIKRDDINKIALLHASGLLNADTRVQDTHPFTHAFRRDSTRTMQYLHEHNLSTFGDATSITSGEEFITRTNPNGSVQARGRNTFGELGSGSSDFIGESTPDVRDVTTVTSGEHHTLAITRTHTLFGWGSNTASQLLPRQRNAFFLASPTVLMQNVRSASAEAHHSLAVTRDDVMWGWGSNSFGQLGFVDEHGRWWGTRERSRFTMNDLSPNGVTTDALGLGIAPVRMMQDVREVHAAYASSFAVTHADELRMWGRVPDNLGETIMLADGEVIMRNIITAAVGKYHVLTVNRDHELYSFGYGYGGELGVADTETSLRPRFVMRDVQAVAAGRNHSLALTNDGTLWGWGHNHAQQLGKRTPAFVRSPRVIMRNVVSIRAGRTMSFAARADGRFWSIGNEP